MKSKWMALKSSFGWMCSSLKHGSLRPNSLTSWLMFCQLRNPLRYSEIMGLLNWRTLALTGVFWIKQAIVDWNCVSRLVRECWSGLNIRTRAFSGAGLAGLSVGILCACTAALWLGHNSKQRPNTLPSIVAAITSTPHMCVCSRKKRKKIV